MMDNIIKILYCENEYNTYMNQWQRMHFFDELDHHNCYITVIDPQKYKTNEEANEDIIRQLKTEKYNLFMTSFNEKTVYKETVEKIKLLGIPTLLICFDSTTVPFVHYNIAPFYDLVWLTSGGTKYLFDKRNCNSIFLPYAANPYINRGEETEIGIGFVGSPYGSRANTINSLSQNGINVFCHCKRPESRLSMANKKKHKYKLSVALKMLQYPQGRKLIRGAIVNRFKPMSELIESEFLHIEDSVPFELLYPTYAKYSLSLSMPEARNTGVLKKPLFGVPLRSFEVPMAGGILFCRRTLELLEYFEDEKEAVFFDSEEEMIAKAQYYLSPDKQSIRNSIRSNAVRKAEANHTWWNRFTKIFDYFSIKY